MTKAVMPPVGVVIVNYNNAAYVGQAIDSIARQTVRDVRTIVVDNCSTDDSELVIEQKLNQLGDRRFDYIRNISNQGQAGAIRAGLRCLQTPFVCFLDSDDYLYEDFIARHVAAHVNADFPVALTFCDSHIVDAEGKLLAGTAWWFDHKEEKASRPVHAIHLPAVNGAEGEVSFEQTGRATLHMEWTPHQASNSMASMMFRRAFVDLVLTPEDSELQLYVDYYLSTFAALLTGTISLADALYAYRMHGANNHSDAKVFGGQYNSSTKAWDPIRNRIWKVVLRTFEQEANGLQRAFGSHRVQHAQNQLSQALGTLASEGQPRKRLDLQRLILRP
jgi:glycosyltransferase involved in cell wall biosynthesis